jgi:membrane protein YqaA with SNARE-associated domain
MRSAFYQVLGYFLTPAGLVLLGVLDASIVFMLPLGIDFAVVILAARKPVLFWLYALLATAGSVAGGLVTFWIGCKLGERGLALLIKPSRLARVKQRVSRQAALSVAALGVIPPPFPFTAFVLVSGAVGANPWTFCLMLAASRLVRFLAEAGLAAIYGRRILAWMQSTAFEVIVGALTVLAVAGTLISAVALYRSTRGDRRRVRAAS